MRKGVLGIACSCLLLAVGAGAAAADTMHPELGAQMAKFNPSLRKVVSDSVYEEIPPG